MNKKAIITITDGHNFTEGTNGGRSYISVDMQCNTYGLGCPCETEEQVKSAIQHAKEWIIKEGDKAIIIDKRMTLNLWFSEETTSA